MNCDNNPLVETCLCDFSLTRVVTTAGVYYRVTADSRYQDIDSDQQVTICCGKLLDDNTFENETVCRLLGWTPSPYQTELKNFWTNVDNEYPDRIYLDSNGRLPSWSLLPPSWYYMGVELNGVTRYYQIGRRPANKPQELLYNTSAGCVQTSKIYLIATSTCNGCLASNMTLLSRTQEYPGGGCFLSDALCGECPKGYSCVFGYCEYTGEENEEEEIDEEEQEENTDNMFKYIVIGTSIFFLFIMFFIFIA